MKRIPKSAPTLNRMGNGLNQPDDRVMTEPNLDYGGWEVTTCSNIEPEPITRERLYRLLEQMREPLPWLPPLRLQNARLLYQDVNDNEE